MNIPSTERKLREAAYFLQRLSDKAATPVRDPEEVLHLLSAFLSAGRSVTFVLQVEAKEAYDSWFPAWRERLDTDEQKLLKAMNRQRVSELHQTGADVRAELQYVPITEIHTGERHHPAYGFHWFGPPGTPNPTIGRVDHFFDLGDSPAAVGQSCRRYYALLERLVRDFGAAARAEGGDATSPA